MTEPSFYDRDDYGCIINGEGTYRNAATDLVRHPLVLNWTDERGTMYTILLVLDPVRFGAPGGPVDPGSYKLWVGIARRGCFAFSVRGTLVTPEYVAEKLGIPSWVTAGAVADLLTGIRGVLTEWVEAGK